MTTKPTPSAHTQRPPTPPAKPATHLPAHGSAAATQYPGSGSKGCK
jgi:hypothetical protein